MERKKKKNDNNCGVERKKKKNDDNWREFRSRKSRRIRKEQVFLVLIFEQERLQSLYLSTLLIYNKREGCVRNTELRSLRFVGSYCVAMEGESCPPLTRSARIVLG